jgi:hypothetical protein
MVQDFLETDYAATLISEVRIRLANLAASLAELRRAKYSTAISAF